MVIIVATPELISVRDADRLPSALKSAIEQINLVLGISVDMVKGDMMILTPL